MAWEIETDERESERDRERQRETERVAKGVLKICSKFTREHPCQIDR